MHSQLPARVESKIAHEPMTGCWLWAGASARHGYGVVWANKKLAMAHRYVYETLVGPVPAAKELDHKCRVKCCVNPAHMEPVSHAENLRRRAPFRHRIARTTCKRGHVGMIRVGKNGARACSVCRREWHQARAGRA